MRADPMKTFDVTTEERDEAVHVRLLAASSTSRARPRSRTSSRASRPTRPELIVLDLRELAFMDSTACGC